MSSVCFVIQAYRFLMSQSKSLDFHLFGSPRQWTRLKTWLLSWLKSWHLELEHLLIDFIPDMLWFTKVRHNTRWINPCFCYLRHHHHCTHLAEIYSLLSALFYFCLFLFFWVGMIYRMKNENDISFKVLEITIMNNTGFTLNCV